MFSLLLLLPEKIVAVFRHRQDLVLEDLELRQQSAVLQRSVKRSRFTSAERCFWTLFYRFWD